MDVVKDLGANPECFEFLAAIINEDFKKAREKGFDFLDDFIPESMLKVFKGVVALYEDDLEALNDTAELIGVPSSILKIFVAFYKKDEAAASMLLEEVFEFIQEVVLKD